MGRLCGGAHEISGIKAPIFLRGWVGGGDGGTHSVDMWLFHFSKVPIKFENLPTMNMINVNIYSQLIITFQLKLNPVTKKLLTKVVK